MILPSRTATAEWVGAVRSTGRLGGGGVLLLLVAMLVSVLVARPADAKTFTVTSTQNFSDIDPGDGVCDTIAVDLLNPCTLRGAIQEANALVGMDTIHFDIPGGGVRTIEPNSQLPVVTQRVR